jgi:hypothetical protein
MSALDDARAALAAAELRRVRAAFEANPSKETGFDLILAAHQLWNNGSLTGTSFDRAIECVRDWDQQEQLKANDPKNPRNLPRLLRVLIENRLYTALLSGRMEDDLYTAQVNALECAAVFIEDQLTAFDAAYDIDKRLDDTETSPTGSDYNEVIALFGCAHLSGTPKRF